MHHNRCMANLNGCIALSGLQTWHVTGADARTFLHGQLTQDIALMKPNQARWSAYCTPKGRMFTTVLVQSSEQQNNDDLWLTLPSDTATQTVQRLRMFVMRAKCTFEVQNGVNLWGVAGQHIPIELADQVWARWHDRSQSCVWVRLPSAGSVARALCWAPANVHPPGNDIPLSIETWNWLEIMAAQPWVTLNLQELYIPQMFNLESIEGISFKKGCYPGQEVVARSQFRGAVKRKTTRVRIKVDPNLENVPKLMSGRLDLIDNDTGDTLGEIYRAAFDPNDAHILDALAIVPIEWTQSADWSHLTAKVRFNDHELTVHHMGLPYPIRQDL